METSSGVQRFAIMHNVYSACEWSIDYRRLV